MIAVMTRDSGRLRGFAKLGAFLLASVTLGLIGLMGILFNARAPHLQASGMFSHVVMHTGKGSSTRFNLIGHSQETINSLHISSAKSQIMAGEDAEIIYQAQSGLVLSLHIVDGPHAGFIYTESDRGGEGYFAILLAIGLAGFGIVNFFNDGSAYAGGRDDSPAPEGDTDARSMLQL